jgi:hypothetical protein
MAEPKVFTGALAIIRKNGTPIGKMRNIRWTEDIGRGEVRGIGTTLTSEAPALSWAGRGSCEFYSVDFTTTGLGGIKRAVKTNQEFDDQLMLEGDGLQLDIFKKVADIIDPDTGNVIPKAEPYATLAQVFIESEDGDVTEGAISGQNQSFRYLSPIKQPQ